MEGRSVETFLTIVSRRESRDYNFTADPVPPELVNRLLESARIAGSGRNRQTARFTVIQSREVLDALSETVSRAANLLGSQLAIAIAVRGEGMTAFDGGRAAENMLLTAWDAGLGSCPNGFTDKPRAAELLELGADQEPLILLTFGYPMRTPRPERRTAEEWLARANRLPLDELVQAWL